MDIKTRISIGIRAIRKRRGLSQEEMAELINRSPDAISNLERGKSLPTIETLDELAKGLKIPLADFFLDAETDDPDRAEAIARLNDVVRQLDSRTLDTATAIMEVLAEHAKS